MSTRRRRWPWLVAAVLLVGVASLLMRVGEGAPPPRPTWDRIDIPRRARSADWERQEKRQVLPDVLPPVVPEGQPQPPARPKDPVLAGLGSGFKKGAYVIEANAIRNSPVGQLLIDCITSEDEGEGLAQFRTLTGLDPLTDLDRVGVIDDTVIFSGNFKALKTEVLREGVPTAFGADGMLYSDQKPDGGVGRYLATWRDQMIITGKDPEALKQALERIEGARPMEPGGLSDQQAYGEIYGLLSPEAIVEFFGDDNAQLGERLTQVSQRVELHVDTSNDLGVAAQVETTNPNDAKEVSKALGAAMSLARLRAQAEGKSEVADLLDMSRVTNEGAGFRFEAGVPLPWLETSLKQCVERNKARRAARAAGDAGE